MKGVTLRGVGRAGHFSLSFPIRRSELLQEYMPGGAMAIIGPACARHVDHGPDAKAWRLVLAPGVPVGDAQVSL